MTFTPPASLGSFTFPAPYGTQGIRLTNAVNALNGCEPRMYPYWSSVNNHRGEDHLFVLVGRVGLRPMIVMVRKTDGAVTSYWELSLDGTAEGWYFSDTLPHKFYLIQGNRLARYDVVTNQMETIFTLDRKIGAFIKQAHSSGDDRVHSATVQDGDYRMIGYVVVEGDRQEFFPAVGTPDECQIDKSGDFLVVQENDDNRFVEWRHRLTRFISNDEGAVAHCDVGYKFVIGEDDQHEPGALVKWQLDVWSQRKVIWQAPDWGPGMGHAADRGDLVILSSNWSQEILALSLSHAHPERPIAPGMLAQWPAGHPLAYDTQLRANVDPLGEWCCWVTNLHDLGGPFHAFLARVGAPITPIEPPIKPGGKLVPGSQPYPDEPTWWSQVLAEIGDIYDKKGEPFNLGMFKWSTRISYDIGIGMDKEQSRAKHLAELRAELGV